MQNNIKAEQRLIQALLAAGADPNVQNISKKDGPGWTALHTAAMHDKLDHAKALITGGADPNICASDGCTAFGLAGSPEMITLLQNATGAPRPSPPGLWARLFGR